MATSTGSTLNVVASAQNTLPADDSAWKALTYVEVGDVATIGPLGDSHERITVTALKDGRTVSFPGAIDGGELQVAINTENSGDAGQTAIRNANGSADTYAFKIDDATGQDAYFLGRVANLMESERSPSVNRGLTFTIWRVTAVQYIT